MFPRRNKRRDEVMADTKDVLIVFDHDKKISDINRVDEVDAEKVVVYGKYVVPIADCEITTGGEGRHFFYRAPTRSIQETNRLAQLERSIVLSQITQYKKPEQNQTDLTKILLIGVICLAFIVMGLSSCGA